MCVFARRDSGSRGKTPLFSGRDSGSGLILRARCGAILAQNDKILDWGIFVKNKELWRANGAADWYRGAVFGLRRACESFSGWRARRRFPDMIVRLKLGKVKQN